MAELELPPSLPLRSPLYSPEPLGIGTGLVESLASYLARLAEAHLVSAPELMAYMAFGATEDRQSKDHRIYNLMRLPSRSLNGMQQIAQRWSALVAKQTRRPGMDQLTLLPWCQMVTPRALTHASQCWCPQCLDERVKAGQSAYWPLLWSLRAVTVCPIHRIWLEQRCPRCQAAVPSLTAHRRIGFCPKCGSWLGWEGRPGSKGRPVPEAPGVTEEAVHMATEALRLLGVSSLTQERVAIDKLVGLLESCLQAANCRQAVLAKRLGLSLTRLNRLLCRRSLVTVPILLHVLACLGLDIADFVQKPVATMVSCGDLDDFVSRLPPKRVSARPSRLKPGQRASLELLAEVQATLEAALTEDDPPGLLTLARRVGLRKVKLLRSHYPHLCRAITEKRKSRFHPDAARQVLAAIVSWEATPPSVEAIASQLKTSPVTLRKFFPDEVAAIKAQRRIIRDVAELRHNVAAFLEVDPPLSFSEISRRLGIKTHHFRQHCPDLQQALVQRFATYQHTCAVERERKSIAAVRNAVARLNASGQFPTKSKVAAILGRTQRLILSKTESEAFREMMHELGLWQR